MQSYEKLEKPYKAGETWYTAHRNSSGYGYEHLELDIYQANEYGYEQEVFKLTFQADTSTDHWYGFHIEVRADNVNEMMDAAKLVKKLLSAENDSWEMGLEKVLDRLESRKCVQRVRDSRFHTYLLPKDIPPPEVRRWIDQYQRLGRSFCFASVYAESEKEAQALIRQEMAKDKDRLLEYLNADEPVMPVEYEEAPTFTPVREMAKLSWVEEKALQAV